MVESKLVSIERFFEGIPTTENQAALEGTFLQETISDYRATAFGIMLDDLVSRVPDSSTLQQSQDLVAFIQRASETIYRELNKVIIISLK